MSFTTSFNYDDGPFETFGDSDNLEEYDTELNKTLKHTISCNQCNCSYTVTGIKIDEGSISIRWVCNRNSTHTGSSLYEFEFDGNKDVVITDINHGSSKV